MKKCLRSLLVGFALLLPVWVQAQILDFDSVCASPPCAATSLYSAAGVTISTGNVVAAGTNGLTGTNGGKYLSIAAFPYQVQFSLARQATFFSAVMSRASTSSGTVTVQVTALKSGSPVGGPYTITLTNVNTWSPVSFSIAGGFDAVFMDPSGGANLTFGIDNVQIAGNCFGFSDVAPTDSFCNAAEWLGNRGVTTGCALGQYCPANNVTRAQMALFMNRLGNTLTPTVYNPYQYFISQSGFPAVQDSIVYCKQGIPAASYPRKLVWNGYMGITSVGANATVRMLPVITFDGGTNWARFDLDPFIYQTITTTAFSIISNTAIRALPADFPATVGFYVERSGGSATGISGECSATVAIFNATSGSAPFDAPPDLRHP